jgi:hypothetical protein
MNDQDMEYLGNINTSPGPNAGRSIDPKPGADDLRHEPDPTKVICPNCAHQFTAISVTDQERLRAQSDVEPVAINDAKEQALSEVYVKIFEDGRAQFNAEPVGILHNTEGGFKEIVTRDTPTIYDNNPQPRLVEEIFDFNRQLIGFRVYDAADRSGK